MDYKQWEFQLAEGGIEGVQKLIGTFLSKGDQKKREDPIDKLKKKVELH